MKHFKQTGYNTKNNAYSYRLGIDASISTRNANTLSWRKKIYEFNSTHGFLPINGEGYFDKNIAILEILFNLKHNREKVE